MSVGTTTVSASAEMRSTGCRESSGGLQRRVLGACRMDVLLPFSGEIKRSTGWGELREYAVEAKQHQGFGTRTRSGRSREALTIALCGLAVVASALFGAGTAGAESDGPTPPKEPVTAAPSTTVISGSIITISQAAVPTQGACNPFAQAQLTYATKSDDAKFQLIVSSLTTPCSPINAAAVVYAMPKGATYSGGQWPQTLVERKDFSITTASVTTITFAKACDAQQFDVITGESPKVISPTGEHHGPLLFPTDVATSQQFFPSAEKCGGATTTTSTTTSTIPANVLPATTLPPAASNAVAPGAVVADKTATNNPEVATLALTGTYSAPLAALGALLLAAGVGMFAVSRRKRDQ